jgi:hypothetical protein
MARKRPSTHSDAQFALFLEQMKNSLDGTAKSEFENAVRRLIGVVNKGPADTDPADIDPPDTDLGERSDDPRAGSSNGAVQPSSASSSATPIPSALGHLPEPPDFEAIESAARGTSASRANLLALIGQLVFSSSNNESLLIYILMVLLETDEPSAAIVFSTLNTTRARLDLVSRLVKIKIADREMRDELEQVVKEFNDAQQVRNEFLHAMYTVDGKGAITHTQTMRFIMKGGKVSFGEQNPIDQKRLDGILKALRDLRSLNRTIWDLLPRLRDAIAKSKTKVAPAIPSGRTAQKGA